MIGITIMERGRFEQEPIAFLESKGYQNVTMDKLIKLPKYSLFEFENGRRRLLASAKELQKGNQLYLPEHLVTFLYWCGRINHPIEGSKYSEEVRNHVAYFEEILSYISKFEERYLLLPKPMMKIRQLFEKKRQLSIEALATSFVNLLSFTASGAPTAFDYLGEKIDRQRYQSTKECLNATIIHQSITGLYETHIDLSQFGED